mmetsp:Transcript_28261/g.31282  ORF Transcript_28261/g.31282 Transcript_28261/m.31282 type:complete len:183 (-) Transcript_28261:175-723(-)
MSSNLLRRSSSVLQRRITTTTTKPSVALRRAPQQKQLQQRRSMGGAVEMPTPRSMIAEPWQGHPKHEEGWEKDLYYTYGAATFLIILSNCFKPDNHATTWAAEEAQARLDLKDQGFDKFEFGKHYKGMSLAQAQDGAPADEDPVAALLNNSEEEWEKFNEKAIKTEDDDDNDEDEEEEEDGE